MPSVRKTRLPTLKHVPRELREIPDQLHTAITEELQEKPDLLVHLSKWLFLAAIVGAATGLIATAFLYALEFSMNSLDPSRAPFIVIPIAFVLNVLFLRFVFPRAGKPGTNSAIASIHKGTTISPWIGVRAFIAPILTIAGGGSAGKEAPAADVGSTMGTLLGFLFRFDAEDRRKLAICGISAGFASVIGAPIAGAIFGVEVLFVGSLMYSVLLPAFVAGVVGYGVAAGLNAPFIAAPSIIVPEISTAFFLKVVFAGILFGLVALAFIGVISVARKIARAQQWRGLVFAAIGGVLLASLVTVTSTDYLGLGGDVIDRAVAGDELNPRAPLYKSLATGITIASGGSGGLITPVLFVGSTIGNVLGSVMNADPQVFAALGAVALLAAAMNTPIAASVLGIELFGPAIAPFAAIACILAFSLTGKKSVYPSQIHVVEKVPPGPALAGHVGSTIKRTVRGLQKKKP